mmetsp:Transcript_113268/g.225583  ORF Transcript_113268/g.225583 Transcript_113268/m.225583 type:complete len:352 (+) Transcript_113268:69-1124(+)|eukprot:CAMPEP_0172724438 /NCGR_PEP_ID=MMETSP1074-20121228/86002_1 /TAXON_ID=2916 /ORGANISM="Ceratium fusus, Strain PA161109" /LENGTH=351 /DNA_ID=CAMNT_0013550917 /DNA_START=52 /DNA_END=1107 /DNA_ORIENTATION=-
MVGHDVLEVRASWGNSSASTACGADTPAGRRWVDLADMSDDEDTFLPLDGSNVDIASAPTNLSSALDDERSLGSSDFEGFSSSGRATNSWQPTVSAPEFMPTMSTVCPWVGVCYVLPLGASPSLRPSLTPVATPRLSVSSAAMQPVTYAESEAWRCQDPVPLAGDGCQRWKRNGGSAGNCQGESLAARRGWAGCSVKRPRAGTQRSSVSGCPSSTGSRRATICQLQQGEMPEATEDEWQHRFEVREKSVAISKETAVYQWYSSLKPREARADNEPMTPDPRDRTVSKRRWKYLVQCWRTTMHNMYIEDNQMSRQSTDDRHSIDDWASTVTVATEMEGTMASFDDAEDAIST